MRQTHRIANLVGSVTFVAVSLLPGARPAGAQEPVEPQLSVAPEESNRLEVDFGIEGKVHFRDSEDVRIASPFPFPSSFLPLGQTQGFLETVSPGQHFEVSVLTLLADARWGDGIVAHAKVDIVDLYDRNPTSSDQKVDVDELWIRFGRDPRDWAGGFGGYAKVGKFEKFERQNDRHLESYGLVSTAFNRFEDQGLEIGVDLGRHVYLRGSLTQGNPVFIRDPNALAGDNGTPDGDPRTHANPVPRLNSGFTIFYDAEVEDLDVGGDLETGLGVGVRFGDLDSKRALDVLVYGYERELANGVTLNGTYYHGDLDLLRGPLHTPTSAPFSLPITGTKKKELGADVKLYLGGFCAFAQYVEQELAGMDRTGVEAELSYRFELPLGATVGGRQLFPSIQPAVRWSRLEPEFGGPSVRYPAPSARWNWTKLDYGVRVVVIEGVDLTVEYADNDMELFNGNSLKYSELLSTLRFRM